MRITITKGKAADTINVRRSDGSVASSTFPHKGPVPHDAVHFFVESALGIHDGFWGMVAQGRHPEEIGMIAKAAGHASAARAQTPDPSIVSAIQAERLVECFEADLWAGPSDPQTFLETFKAGCEQSLVPTFPIDERIIAQIRHRIGEFRDHWLSLALNESYSLEWPNGGYAE